LTRGRWRGSIGSIGGGASLTRGRWRGSIGSMGGGASSWPNMTRGAALLGSCCTLHVGHSWRACSTRTPGRVLACCWPVLQALTRVAGQLQPLHACAGRLQRQGAAHTAAPGPPAPHRAPHVPGIPAGPHGSVPCPGIPCPVAAGAGLWPGMHRGMMRGAAYSPRPGMHRGRACTVADCKRGEWAASRIRCRRAAWSVSGSSSSAPRFDLHRLLGAVQRSRTRCTSLAGCVTHPLQRSA
jgi:hypothetical protein